MALGGAAAAHAEEGPKSEKAVKVQEEQDAKAKSIGNGGGKVDVNDLTLKADDKLGNGIKGESVTAQGQVDMKMTTLNNKPDDKLGNGIKGEAVAMQGQLDDKLGNGVKGVEAKKDAKTVAK